MVDLTINAMAEKFNQLPKPIQQMALGGSAGWLTGFTLLKFGKGAGFGVGATIFILQLGQHFGYLKINWNQVKKDIQKAQSEVKKQADSHIPVIAGKVDQAIRDNLIMASSFVAGFFLGASTA